MPRAYVRKKETKYTLEDLQQAVKDVKEKKKTYRQAEEFYNVPISVIFHRIKGRKIDVNRIGAGVSKVLSDRVEAHIVACLKVRAQMGHPVLKEELKLIVKEYVEINNIKTPFKDNKPGDDWYLSFMKRHPELSLKKPEHLQKARKDARKPHVVYGFYDLLNSVVQENGLKEKPMYIYNCDESGFQSDPSKMRAIGQKGKPLYRVSGGSGRESTTVLACVSADGQTLPPLIVYKGAAVQARWTSEKSFPGTLYGATKNGWMEEPVFFNWLTKSFIPHVNTLRNERNEPNQKALLIYDGHSSHISVRIIEEAEKSNIALLKFPSHLTDRIQPLDKCVFGPVKKTWDKKLIEYGVKQMGNGSGRLTRTQFAELLGEVYEIALKSQNIISGFTTTGLYPVDPSKFPKNLFTAEDLKLYNDVLNNEEDNRQQLIPEIGIEQLDLERYHRENQQTTNKEAQQAKMRNKEIIIPQIDIEKKQVEMQNEETDNQEEIETRHVDMQNEGTDNQEEIETEQVDMQNEGTDNQEEIETEQDDMQNEGTDNQKEIEKEQDDIQNEETDNQEEIETEQVDMQNEEIVEIDIHTEQCPVKDTQEENKNQNRNTEKRQMVPDDNINSQKTKIRKIDKQIKIQQSDIRKGKVKIQNADKYDQEEMETEQIDMQNEEIVEIDIQTERFPLKDTQKENYTHNRNKERRQMVPENNINLQKTKIRKMDKHMKVPQVNEGMEHADLQIEEKDTQKKQRIQIDKHQQVEASSKNMIEEIDPLKKNNYGIEMQLERQGEQKDTYIENIAIKKQQMGTQKKDTKREPTNTCLINNIMKMISLDTVTNSERKNKIINALILTLNEEKQNEIPEQSPNKEALQQIFGVCATPEKAKKVVVPRLKQSAFGEILTCEEVKERLRLAEEKKCKTKKNKTGKLMDITNEAKVANNSDKMKKGKGKGSKIKAKTKKETNKKAIIRTKNKKRKVESEDSESDIVMSTHSDSDIADAGSDANITDHDEMFLEEKDTTLTYTSPAAGSSKPKELIDVIDYNIHDNVLVRYILKNRVEYYVGKIINKTHDNYKVSFYKRSGRNDNTKFTVSKKEDVDCILPGMIVKNVNLLTLNEKETEFIFMDDEDSVYFD